MRALDVATRPVITVRAETPVRDVARTLTEHDVRGVPVVDDDEKVVGFVSESDILEELKTQYDAIDTVYLPTPFDFLEIPLRSVLETEELRNMFDTAAAIDAGSIMRRRVVTIRQDASLEEAASLMHRKKIGHLPVVDDDGKLVGIMSRHDVVRAIAEHE